MPAFIVSYDLRKTNHNYDSLYEALFVIDATRIQDSVWGVRTASNAIQVFNFLWRHMHKQKDRLFVVPFDYKKQYRSQNSIEQWRSMR
jgi:hypothetical protein